MNEIQGLAEAILSCVELVCVIDEESRDVLYMSGALERETFPDAVGGKCYRVLFGRESPCPFCPALEAPASGQSYGPLYAWESYSPVVGKWLRLKNRLVRLEGRLCRVGDLNVLGDAMELSREAILEMAALQEQKRAYQRLVADLDYAAGHDSMTGLYNHARYRQDLEGWFREGKCGGVIFFDLNDLKQTNDRFGHEKGDLLLRKLGHVLAWVQGELTRAYRIGGDEFVLLCRDCSQNILERLRGQVEAALAGGQEDEIPCSAASGLAWSLAPIDGAALAALADQRMYQHKREMKGARDRVERETEDE